MATDRSQVLYHSCRTVVTRETTPSGTVIRKQCEGTDGPARVRSETAVLRRLSGVPGTPRAVEGDVGGSATVLLVADTGHVSLGEYLSTGRPDPAWLLGFARDLAGLLGRVHAAGVLHRDLSPGNVLLRPDGSDLMLVDFEMATTFADDRPEFVHPTEIAGTLPYLAPELTGRTGRAADHRADLYALGALLYEMATGQPPFGRAGEPLDLIHAHLARTPVPPSDVDPEVPPMLSAIIMRLLSKEPDHRYSSADGLARDLSRLVAAEDPGSVAFPLGAVDFPPRLSAPSRLVGRGTEVAGLRAAFEAAVAGRGPRGALVAGPSGVGKTALLDELRPTVMTSGSGWFIGGKFDQYRRDQLTVAIVASLRSLGRLLLAEPEAEVARVRRRLLAALGPNAAHLTAMVPEFARLLDVPGRLWDGDPAEGARRGHRAFVQVLGAVAGPRRPVVMVLDDLQWASSFALGALDAILTDDGLDGVFVVGGYRDGEVPPTHPLAALMNRWQRLDALAEVITLHNLPGPDLGTFLTEMLRMPSGTATDLADAIAAHTDGNPFDTVELVNALRREGVLALTDDGWRWDAGEVRRFVSAGEVLTLIEQRVARLPEDTREMLRTLACLGGSVEFPVLRAVVPVAEEQQPWLPALEDGLLLLDRAGAGTLRFRHDRVQQAVRAAMSPEETRDRHLALAQHLAGEGLFPAVAAEQYLAGADGLTHPAERAAVAALFETAAEQAGGIANHDVAERYLSRAIGLLDGSDGTDPDGTDPDGTDPDRGDPDGADPDPSRALRLRLMVRRHAALCVLGRFDEGDAEFERITGLLHDPAGRARVTAVQLSSLVNRGHLPEALALGKEAMARLGHPAPDQEVLPREIAAGLEQLRSWAQDWDGWPDPERAENTDETIEAVGLLINRMIPTAFFSGDPLMAWLVCEAARLWELHGPLSILIGPLAHASFATIALARDHRTGYAVVRRVLEDSRARGYGAAHAQALFLHSLSAAPWFEPADEVAEAARDAREALIREGDLWNASFTYYSSVYHAFSHATTLPEGEAEADAGIAFTRRTGNDLTTAALVSYRQAMRSLQGLTAAPGELDEPGFDSGAHLAGLGPNLTAAVVFHVCSACLAGVFGDQARLARHSAEAMPLLPFIEASQGTTEARLWRGLSLCRAARADTTGERDALLAELDPILAWARDRAEEAPANFGHIRHLLEAERAWAVGDLDAASTSFEQAGEAVRHSRTPGHASVVSEDYARFLLATGREHLGELVLREARRKYARWGAAGKVSQLEEEFPHLGDGEETPSSGPGSVAEVTLRPASSTLSSDGVDLVGILRAFQVLSAETSPVRLQDRVAEILAMLTGATQVRLVLRESASGGWGLPRPGGNDAAMMPLDEAVAEGLVAASVIRYVERAGDSVVVDDIGRDARFGADPYFAGAQRCSLMAVPILSRGLPRAVLVMENRLARGAFTARRMDVVQLIAGELGVCLDNLLAERFRSLVQRSAELTVVCDRETVITYSSTASADLLGLRATDLLGQRLTEVFATEDVGGVEEAVRGVRAETPVTLTARVRHVDARPRWAEATVTDLTDDPAVGGVMLRLRDITERHRLEIELRHAQKLESVGQLAAGLAHEINSPMQFITGNLQFLTDAFGQLAEDRDGVAVGGVQELLAEIPQALEESIDGARRVVDIIAAMKVFGQPAAEGKAHVDLNGAVRNTLTVAANEIGACADVVTDLADLPPVWGNLGDLNQVLLNLVVNAVHAMSEKAAGTGERGTLTVRTRAEGEEVVVEVGDTGVGIPDEITERVFDPFFTTRDVGAGTGQGLAVARALVHDRHDGRLEFETVPGGGTTFAVRLPIAGRGDGGPG